MSHYSVAIVILTNSATDNAAVYRALGTAKEFQEAGDDVTIVFDGSGAESLAALSHSSHALNGMLESLRDQVAGVCGFCATAHKVAAEITEAGFPMLTDNHGHASIRNLVVEGRTILTF
ncbi:hypothetical protein BH23ACT6_BH23ACT6_03900 [soil metagenome]